MHNTAVRTTISRKCRVLATFSIAILVIVSSSVRLSAQTNGWTQILYSDSIMRTWIAFDGSGSLWGVNGYRILGSFYGGVGRFDGSTWKNYSTANGLSNDTLSCLTRDRQGRIWCAGNKCVAYYDEKSDRWTSIPVQDSLSSVRDYVSIVCDSQGNIWAASIPKVVF